ncbi:hypothetical protein ACFWBC_39005, partial [Streptomyces sp. NPDC059985]|uniref:hypothetical protein n=1 Tax=Streptomyces sp. NPDC059985 TaxID=3347025 RepID=UPI0036D1F2C3
MVNFVSKNFVNRAEAAESGAAISPVTLSPSSRPGRGLRRGVGAAIAVVMGVTLAPTAFAGSASAESGVA